MAKKSGEPGCSSTVFVYLLFMLGVPALFGLLIAQDQAGTGVGFLVVGGLLFAAFAYFERWGDKYGKDE
jgi:hypothetical protein